VPAVSDRTNNPLSAMAPKADAKPKAKADAKTKAPKKKEEGEEEKVKVSPPDKQAFEDKVAKIQEDIEKLQRKQKGISDKIAERSGGKDEFYAKKAELRAQLDELSGKINELYAKKDELEKAVTGKKEEGKQMRTQLNNMKQSIGFTNEKDIDKRIADIEFQLCTTSMALKDEKKLLAEIQQLKRNRPKVSQVAQMESQLSNFDPGLSIKDQKQAIMDELQQYREAKKKVSDKMTELTEQRKAQTGDLGGILEQKEEISKLIGAKIKERNEVRDAFRQEEREYNQYLAEQRKARQAKAEEERTARQAEFDLRRKQREVEKLDDEPYVAERTLIEQTIFFCKSLVQEKEEDKKEEKKEVTHDLKAGEEVLVSKENRDEEFYFMPTKAKKTKSKNKGSAAQSGKSIKHNAETFQLFDKLKLDAPLTTDDIPALLEKLEVQLEEYKAKVKEWEEKREDMKKAILEGLAEIEEKKTEEESKEEPKAAEEEA